MRRCTRRRRRQDFPFNESGVVNKTVLDARVVEYDTTPETQAASTVTVSGGRLKRSATHAQAGADVDTAASVTHAAGLGWEIFVVGPGGDLHMASHKIGKFHHSSLLGGGSVAMAGELQVNGGVVTTMSNKSGHYSPTAQAFIRFLKVLEAQGLPLGFNVQGFGVPGGSTARQWVDQVNLQEATGAPVPVGGVKAPERLDVETAWESYIADGKNPMKYCTDSVTDGGLGWRVSLTHGGFEEPVAALVGPPTWARLSHDAVRAALEAKWGPPKKRIRKKVDDPLAPPHSDQIDQLRWQ